MIETVSYLFDKICAKVGEKYNQIIQPVPNEVLLHQIDEELRPCNLDWGALKTPAHKKFVQNKILDWFKALNRATYLGGNLMSVSPLVATVADTGKSNKIDYTPQEQKRLEKFLEALTRCLYKIYKKKLEFLKNAHLGKNILIHNSVASLILLVGVAFSLYKAGFRVQAKDSVTFTGGGFTGGVKITRETTKKIHDLPSRPKGFGSKPKITDKEITKPIREIIIWLLFPNKK